MRKIWLIAVATLLMLGCAPATLAPDMPMQVVGPENHALVMDGAA